MWTGCALLVIRWKIKEIPFEINRGFIEGHRLHSFKVCVDGEAHSVTSGPVICHPQHIHMEKDPNAESIRHMNFGGQ